MKLSKRDFPPLTVFLDKFPNINYADIKDDLEDVPMSVVKDEIKNHAKRARSNIFTVSDTIWNLIDSNSLKVMQDFLKTPHDDVFDGAYINKKISLPSLLLYHIDFVKDNDSVLDNDGHYSFIQLFGMKGLEMSMIASCGCYSFKYDAVNRSVLTRGFAIIPGSEKEIEEDACCSDLIKMLELNIFLKYADTEVLTVYGKQKKYVDNGKDYIDNRSGIPVRHIDSRWLREIIRLEDFKVRGHFRLQPFKDEEGEWKKKIIYINEFLKHGYHRRALREDFLSEDVL